MSAPFLLNLSIEFQERSLPVVLELAHVHGKERLQESGVFLPVIEAVVHDEPSESSGNG